MAKFNSSTAVKTRPNTVNKAGGVAFSESARLELASALLTSFLDDKYYESGADRQQRIEELVQQDPLFAAKAAVFARDVFGMRSVSHVVAAAVVKSVKGQTWTKDFINKVVVRPDDMLEIVALYLSKNNKPLPNSLKKGLAKAIGKFDSYQLAKYRGDGKSVSLVDVVNLVHPKPTEKNSEALTKLVNDELRNTETWEAKLTEAGSDEDAKTEAWRELVLSGKIGQFALLRNLRNIIETGDNQIIDKAAELLVNEVSIAKSRVLPFRYHTAYEVVGDSNRIIQIALSRALDISVRNIPNMPGKTLVMVDTSGSMAGRPGDIANLFGAALFKGMDADIMAFATDAAYVTANPTDSVLTISNKIKHTSVGGGTNLSIAFEKANKTYDRIFVLSDMQAWDTRSYYFREGRGVLSSAADYRKRHNASPSIFSFDLAGYGTLQFHENKVYAMSGWSEKVFDLIPYLEEDRHALINRIEQVSLV